MSNLKEFIDFIYSLVNMKEVQEGGFPIPKEITFHLSDDNHISLQKEVHIQKNILEPFTPEDVFFIKAMGVELKFVKNSYVTE